MTQLPEGRAPITSEDLAKLAGHPSTYEAEIEILKAKLARAAARKPVVKPLPWDDKYDGVSRAEYRSRHFYECHRIGDERWVCHEVIHGTGFQVGEIWHSREAAKAACQADYARFILDAIEWEETP